MKTTFPHSFSIYKLIVILFVIFSNFTFINIAHAEETDSNSEPQSSQTHERSVQKLYVKIYDQDTNEYLGRYLLATQVGYTDSPHRMFDDGGINPINIKGYAFVGNPSAMVPVDWKNKSAVTEIKWLMVKTSSDTYKKMQKGLEDAKNNEDSNEAQKPKLNEDGLQIDDDGNVNLHDIYHAYMSFLGHPLPTDSAGYQPTARALYLFQKYLGYDPNKTKEENYRYSTRNQSSSNLSSSSSKASSSTTSSKKATQSKKHVNKKIKKKTKINFNSKLILVGLSLCLVGVLIILIIKRLKLK